MTKKKIYRFWWMEYGYYPSPFERGIIMILTVVGFPLWIIPYLFYLLVYEIGKMDGKPKLVREEEEESQYY